MLRAAQIKCTVTNKGRRVFLGEIRTFEVLVLMRDVMEMLGEDDGGEYRKSLKARLQMRRLVKVHMALW